MCQILSKYEIFTYNYIGDYMFGTNTIGSGLTLTKVLGGISRGLSIANQVIPLYQQAKPMIQNAKKIMGVLREFNSNNNNNNNNSNTNGKTTIDVNKAKEKTEVINHQSGNNPVFFQ